MRVYIDGTISTKQKTFLPATLWFSTEDCDDNTEISEDCICLEGIECESCVEGNKFTCRWKGAELGALDEDDDEAFTEDFTVKDFLEIIKTKKMRLTNMSAFYDEENVAKITNLTFVDADREHDFDLSLVDEIDFC